MVARIDTVEAPESEAEAGVGIEAEHDLARRVELARELDGAAQSRSARMRHLHAGEHPSRGHTKIKIAQPIGRGGPKERRELLLGVLLDIEQRGPLARVDDRIRLFRAEQLHVALEREHGLDARHLAHHLDRGQRRVYAVDGEYVVPQLVHAITINNGDRYSILVKLTEAGEFPIRVASIQNTQIMSASATLKYGTEAPRTTVPYIKDNGVGLNGTIFYLEKNQVQLEPKTVSPTADATHKLFFRVTGPSYEWALNSSIFPAATMDHGSEGVVLFEPDFDAQDNHTITTLKDQWVDLILITATTPMPPHPIHKHGNKMWKIGSGVGPFPWANVAEAIAAVPQNFNLASPPHRDTFMTQLATPTNATWTVLRYHASQPGAWLLHCHVQSHLVGGMSVVIQDGKDAWPEVPKAYLEY